MFKILVVEDDKDLNKTVCSFLNHSGYEAIGCLNANDAYDALTDNIIDLIVSDIMMPRIDGVGCTAVGFVAIIATVIAYRKMSGAAPIKVNVKVVGKVAYGVISALILGLGMAMIMAFEGMMLLGMVVGIVGIVMLLFLIPMCVGLKDNK